MPLIIVHSELHIPTCISESDSGAVPKSPWSLSTLEVPLISATHLATVDISSAPGRSVRGDSVGRNNCTLPKCSSQKRLRNVRRCRCEGPQGIPNAMVPRCF
eukprot:7788745-Pyramimonas_sp.AAC.3